MITLLSPQSGDNVTATVTIQYFSDHNNPARDISVIINGGAQAVSQEQITCNIGDCSFSTNLLDGDNVLQITQGAAISEQIFLSVLTDSGGNGNQVWQLDATQLQEVLDGYYLVDPEVTNQITAHTLILFSVGLGVGLVIKFMKRG